MTRSETQELLVVISHLWPSFKLPADEMNLSGFINSWQSVMTDVDIKHAKMAVAKLARNTDNDYPPSAPQIFKSIWELTTAPSDRLSPEDAWTQRETHPLAAEAFKRIGGQRALGLCEETKVYSLRREFEKVYSSLLSTEREKALALPAVKRHWQALEEQRAERLKALPSPTQPAPQPETPKVVKELAAQMSMPVDAEMQRRADEVAAVKARLALVGGDNGKRRPPPLWPERNNEPPPVVVSSQPDDLNEIPF